MSISLKEIIGTPDNEGWVQIHHFAGLEAEKKEKRGQLVLLLCLKGASEEAATGYGREIISRVYEEYYGNLTGTPMERIEEMLARVGKERPVYLTEKISLSLLICVSWRGFLYLGIWGGGQFFLLREGDLLPLLSGEGKRALVLSGKLEESDLLVFGTQNFFSQVPQGTIRASLQGGDSQSAAEVLSPLVHARADQSQIGAALVKIKKDQEEDSLPKTTPIPSAQKETVSSTPSRAKIKKGLKLKLPKISFPKTKLNLGIGLIILVGLLLLIGGGIYRRRKMTTEKKFTDLITQAEEKLKTAESIAQLQGEQSMELVKETESLIAKAQEIKSENNSLDSLQKRVESLVVVLGGGEKIKPELFFNLNLLAEEARGKQLSITDKELFVLDLQTQKVFEFEYPDKHSEVYAGGEILKEKLLFGAQKAGRFYLLDKEGIVFWDGKSSSDRVVEQEWKEPLSLLSWNSNFYVLDKGEKKLFKLVGLGSGFSTPKDWFTTPPSLDWENIADSAIDGNIWFLSKNGQLAKYFKGTKAAFELENNSQKESKLLALASEGSRLVVLTVENELLVWDKEGVWQGQINLEMGEVIDLALDPAGEWLFFLSKGEIYSLNLNEALP